MDKCKFCGHAHVSKSGFVRGHQRYRCGSCRRHFISGDARKKYSNELKAMAVHMYINNCGFRAIGRILGVPFQLVHYWIRQAGEVVEKEVASRPKDNRDIAILEMDELYSYVEKKRGKHEYGLVSIATETKLLRIT